MVRGRGKGRATLGMIVAAAGYGTRMGTGIPKQHVPVLGIPMLQRTIGVLDACPEVDLVVVVVNAEDVEQCEAEVIAERFDKVVAVVRGGAERGISVRNGLWAFAETDSVDFIGVHDGARPLVTCEEVARALDRLMGDPTLDGVVAGVPSTDTVKVVDEEGIVVATPDRRQVWRAQTPQIFRWDTLLAAYDQPDAVLLRATDDAYLVELNGGRIGMVEGSEENFKVTTSVDLRVAEHVLADRRR